MGVATHGMDAYCGCGAVADEHIHIDGEVVYLEIVPDTELHAHEGDHDHIEEHSAEHGHVETAVEESVAEVISSATTTTTSTTTKEAEIVQC